MEIVNSTHDDIATIFKLYDEGTAYQKTVARKHWKGFEHSLVESEINEGRQWKILVEGAVACVFAVSFNDPHIWQGKDKDPAIYIHRIATNPLFRGNGFVKHIVAWARKYAREKGKQFIRMDTGSGNDKLNNYYIDCGFTYLGVVDLGAAEKLPAHYRGGSSSLFEIKLP